jgi:hypothetical protein
MSGPFTEGFRLNPVGDVLAPWRELLAQHTNDAASGLCPVCRVKDCERGRWAGQRLAEACELAAARTEPREIEPAEAKS